MKSLVAAKLLLRIIPPLWHAIRSSDNFYYLTSLGPKRKVIAQSFTSTSALYCYLNGHTRLETSYFTVVLATLLPSTSKP